MASMRGMGRRLPPRPRKAAKDTAAIPEPEARGTPGCAGRCPAAGTWMQGTRRADAGTAMALATITGT